MRGDTILEIVKRISRASLNIKKKKKSLESKNTLFKNVIHRLEIKKGDKSTLLTLPKKEFRHKINCLTQPLQKKTCPSYKVYIKNVENYIQTKNSVKQGKIQVMLRLSDITFGFIYT